MTNGIIVAGITKTIGAFSDSMTIGMKNSVRRHFREYLPGMMLPPEIRRKSIANIADLLSYYDQSTINRAFHNIDQEKMEGNYLNFLKSVIGKHAIQFIGDDTLLEHPGSHVMESVGWFYDRKDKKNVLAHQTVTTGIYDLVTERFYPFLMRLYRKKDDAGSEFRTKLEIMEELIGIAGNNFNVTGKVLDSWYSSFHLMGDHYVTEMKSDRKASFTNLGKIKPSNHDLFFTMNEILDVTMFMKSRDIDHDSPLKDFPLCRQYNVFLTNGNTVNLLVLYDQESGRKKFLVSDYLDMEGIIGAWDIRWRIETFHNDAKDLGMGEYQVRFREGPLIQAGISSLAYTLLSIMIKDSKRLFGRILTTIGQCSRAIKEVLIFKRSYKSRLFSG
jgi:hypothetical protein